MVNLYGARPRGTDQARVIQVIETKGLVGTGLDKKDPCRIVTQYWDFEGNLLAVADTISENVICLNNIMKGEL